VEVLLKLRTGKERNFKMPEKCPICHSPVRRQEISDKKQVKSVAVFCTNPRCFAQEKAKIIHFVSRRAFDIDGLGEKIVEQLMTEGLIKDVADIFDLKIEDLEPLERFAKKSAQNLIVAIEQSKKVTLAKFLYALGIRHVGEETAIALAENFGTLEKVTKASLENLQSVEDIGGVVAQSLVEHFKDKDNLRLIERLKEGGVKISPQSTAHSPQQKLKGKTFVLTGTLESLSREEAKEKIRKLGGGVSSSVSKNTDYVVVGAEPGSKYDQAQELGVKIINEKEFLSLLK
jgi:DNA ligase (NAD+)